MTGLNLFRLDDRVAAVIGAGSGIGAAAARGCAIHGARVVCLDLDETASTDVAGRIRSDGGQASAMPIDVRSGSQVETAFATIAADQGRLDIVISTPGMNVRKALLDYSEDEFDRVLALNLKGGFHVLRAAGRIMTRQRSGVIVLFSSIRSLVVEPGQSVYAATKAGIVQMVRTAAAEFGPSGVRVNAIAPGIVETPLTAPIKANEKWYAAYAAKTVLNRWAHADEMVGPVLFLVSDAASYVTGSVLIADGGWTAADGRFEPPGM